MTDQLSERRRVIHQVNERASELFIDQASEREQVSDFSSESER